MRFESVTIAAGEKAGCKSRPRMNRRDCKGRAGPARGRRAALPCDDAMRRRRHQPRRPLLAKIRAGQASARDGTWNAVNVNGVADAGHEGADMLNASKLVLFTVGYVGIERWGVDSRRVVNV
jgi:hypothetical protein